MRGARGVDGPMLSQMAHDLIKRLMRRSRWRRTRMRAICAFPTCCHPRLRGSILFVTFNSLTSAVAAEAAIRLDAAKDESSRRQHASPSWAASHQRAYCRQERACGSAQGGACAARRLAETRNAKKKKGGPKEEQKRRIHAAKAGGGGGARDGGVQRKRASKRRRRRRPEAEAVAPLRPPEGLRRPRALAREKGEQVGGGGGSGASEAIEGSSGGGRGGRRCMLRRRLRVSKRFWRTCREWERRPRRVASHSQGGRRERRSRRSEEDKGGK